MRIVYAEVGKKLEVKEVSDLSLEAMQSLVGGYIEVVYPFADPSIVLVCNEEGKLMGLPENRKIIYENYPYFDEDSVAGNFFMVADSPSEGDFCELTDEQIETIKKYFGEAD